MSEDIRSPYHRYYLSHISQKIVVYPQGSNLRDVRVFVNWNMGIITVYGKIDSAIPHFPMDIALPPGVYDQNSGGFNVIASDQIVIDFPIVGNGSWVPVRRLVYSFFIYLPISFSYFFW